MINKKFVDFFDKNPAENLDKDIKKAMQKIKANVYWYEANLRNIQVWFESLDLTEKPDLIGELYF